MLAQHETDRKTGRDLESTSKLILIWVRIIYYLTWILVFLQG